jgi:hypothetical protein
MKKYLIFYFLGLCLTNLTFAAEEPVEAKSGNSVDKFGATAFFCEDENQFDPPCRIAYSNNHTSQEEANQQVLQECGSDCEIVAELTNACGVTVRIDDTWEHNGKIEGYTVVAWSDQTDTVAEPFIPGLEKAILAICDSFVQETHGHLPGYEFKPCSVIESSCPTPTPIVAKSVDFTSEEIKNMEIPNPSGYVSGEFFEGSPGQRLLELGVLTDSHAVFHVTYPSVLDNLVTEPVKGCNSVPEAFPDALPTKVSVYLHDFLASDYSFLPFPVTGDDNFGMLNCHYDLNFDRDTIGDYGQGDKIVTTYCVYAKVPQEKFTFLHNGVSNLPERPVLGIYRSGPDNPIEASEVLIFQDSTYVNIPINRVYQHGEAFPWLVHVGTFKSNVFVPAWQDCHAAPLLAE